MPADTLSDKAPLLGYADRLTVRPKETIAFKVSAKSDEKYSAQLVKLINGDACSSVANYNEIELAASINGDYQGRHQPIYAGCGIALVCEFDWKQLRIHAIIEVRAAGRIFQFHTYEHRAPVIEDHIEFIRHGN